MSGVAGVDPSVTTGITGEVQRSSQIEPSIEARETTSHRNQEIANTNISIGLDIIHRQYIYVGTYNWKTSDAPGTVLATFPIHPDACNQYTNHVYQMFNTWVGGQKARTRIIGTAFYGGGLYFVRIPPNFTQEQIEGMSLAGYTAFPHSDMDPKNLTSIDMILEDYRSTHFHHGPLDLNNPNSFAGWLAIVVNARLVTQSPEVQSIDLRVEMAGDYKFSVAVPIKTGPSQATGPLSVSSLKIRNLQGCDDVSNVTGSTILVAIPSNQRRFHNGNVFQRSAGGDYTYQLNVNSALAGTTGVAQWSSIIGRAREAHDGALGIENDAMFPMHCNTESQLDYPFAQYAAINTAGLTNWAPINFRWGASNGVSATLPHDDGRTTHVTNVNLFFSADKWVVTTAENTSNGTPLLIGALASDHTRTAMDLQDLTPFLRPTQPDPHNESFIGVETNNGHTMSAQALQWSEDLKAFPSWPTAEAALYSLLDRAGTRIAYIKFRQNGHAYTAPTSTAVSLAEGVTLQFEQWVPQEEPLPVVPALIQLYTSAAINAAAARATRRFARQLRNQDAVLSS